MNKSADKSRMAQKARELTTAAKVGILSTIGKDDEYPYGSIVNLLPLKNGDIAMLLSSMAEHQKNLINNPRVSLLIAPSLMKDETLGQERLTLIGRVKVVDDKEPLIKPYLECHPKTEMYVNFKGFQFYRLHVEKIRYIGGFAQAAWIDDVTYQVCSE